MNKKPLSPKKRPGGKTETFGAGKNRGSGKPKLLEPAKIGAPEKAWIPPPGFFDDMPIRRGKHWPVPRNAEEMAIRLERLRAGREKAKAQRIEAAREKARADAAERALTEPFRPGGQRSNRRFDTPPGGRKAQILEALVPGQWFGVPDVIAATGAPPGSVKALLQVLRKEGRAERVKNPDFDAGTHAGAQMEPQWLYRRAQDWAGRLL